MGCRKIDPYREIAGWTKTIFTGYGGDPALASLLSAHFRRLFRARRFGRMLTDAAAYLSADGRCSRLYVRARLRHWFGSQSSAEAPAWLRPELVERLGLRDRWEQLNARAPNGSARPEGYQSVAAPSWTPLLESHDPAILDAAVEFCHPFFDLRVLKFLLSLPVLPWCSDKQLLREAARGVLPDSVRLRKKSPLKSDPIVALLHRPESAWVDSFEAVPELLDYVRPDRIPKLFHTQYAKEAWAHLKPLSLNFWLQRRSAVCRTPISEGAHNHMPIAVS